MDPPEFLGIDVEQLARLRAFVAHHGRSGLERREPAQSQAPEHISDGRQWQRERVGDPRPTLPLLPQPGDLSLHA